MPKKFFKPPNHIIRQWPEVFENLYMSSMPLAYLNTIKLQFKDGRIWEIDVAAVSNLEEATESSNQLLGIIEEYQNEIVKIDFTINIEKLKRDVTDETKKYF